MKKQLFTLVAFFLGLASGFAQNFNVSLRSHVVTETGSNICGYARGGHEYALIGTTAGCRIFDVTNPDAPTLVKLIPGINSQWREIKVWRDHAYITTEASGGGLQIVDMTGLPANLDVPFTTYFGDGIYAGKVSRIHALHIDTAKNFIHAFGCRMTDNEAVGDFVLDINGDPKSPVFVGKWTTNYIHDGYVNNDTLYGGHIYAGHISCINWTNKSNPVLLGTVNTPLLFTHNVWPTNNGKFMVATDEREHSHLSSYDISNPTDMKLLDKTQITPGSGSIVHNTHMIRGDWAVTSWYKDGIVITDCSRPHNLVNVGWYDNFAGSGGGFDGCWGVFPYLPSGTLVLSNINDGLWVLSPTYVRACFLEGKTTNAVTGANLSDVQIAITIPNFAGELSNLKGEYATGYHLAGQYTATFSKPGFISQTHQVSLSNGVVTILDVALSPELTVSGKVILKGTTTPIQNAQVIFAGPSGVFPMNSDAVGNFGLVGISAGTYQVYAGKWGYLHTYKEITLPSANIIIELQKGYQDDFFADLGWTNTATSPTGKWLIAEPLGTLSNNNFSNPEFDIAEDLSDQCYVTGNDAGGVGADDVDDGNVVLTSPAMDLSQMAYPKISFHYWFFNGGGSGTPNDRMVVSLTDGTQKVPVLVEDAPASVWHFSDSIDVRTFLTGDVSNVSFIVEVADDAPGHLLEGAIDAFWAADGTKPTSSTKDFSENWAIEATPNPSNDGFFVRFENPKNAAATIRVTDAAGRQIEVFSTKTSQNGFLLGKNWPAGAYFLTIAADGKKGETIQLMKI